MTSPHEFVPPGPLNSNSSSYTNNTPDIAVQLPNFDAMPRHLSIEARETIKALLLEGEKDHVDIADEAGVFIQTVKNYSSNLLNFGDVLPSKVTRTGRPSLFTKEMRKVSLLHACHCFQVAQYEKADLKTLHAFIEEKPFSFRFEMVDFIAEEYDIDVSETTMSRILEKEQISCKKISHFEFRVY